MTRHTRLAIRRAKPYVVALLVTTAVIAVYGFVGRIEYATLIIANGL